jgi:hypothetical protein
MKVMGMEFHLSSYLPQKIILSLVDDPTLVAGRGKDILNRSF